MRRHIENVEIREITRRLDISAGVTEPFVCQCSDGREYYVKGRYAGYQEMIRELVSAEIATRLSLPIPPYAIARLPDGQVPHGRLDTTTDIGPGPVFASQAVPRAMRYQDSMRAMRGRHQSRALEKTARRIALFGWWIRNPDRSDGNPNLLFSRGRLFIIDHNMAFTGNESLSEFRRRHVFGGLLDLEFSMERERFEREFDAILEAWGEISAMIPCQWLESCHDGEGELGGMLDTLKRYRTDPNGFWN